MVQAAPCSWGTEVAHIIAAVGVVVSACFTAFLAHRRVKADAVAKTARSRSEARQRNMINMLGQLHRKMNGFGPEP